MKKIRRQTLSVNWKCTIMPWWFLAWLMVHNFTASPSYTPDLPEVSILLSPCWKRNGIYIYIAAAREGCGTIFNLPCPFPVLFSPSLSHSSIFYSVLAGPTPVFSPLPLVRVVSRYSSPFLLYPHSFTLKLGVRAFLASLFPQFVFFGIHLILHKCSLPLPFPQSFSAFPTHHSTFP